MISIVNYLDFRAFLKDYFKEQKSLHSCFSYEYFARKIGFRNKGFLYNIINKSKSLSRSHIFKLCSAIDLSAMECRYFETLVAYSKASTARERSHYFQALMSLKAPVHGSAPQQLIDQDQFAYYAHWYHSAIRSLIGINPRKNDAKWLASRLRVPLKGWEVRRSIRLMQRLGLIQKDIEGTLSLSNRIISTGNDIKAVGLIDYYLQHLDLAGRALQDVPRDERHFEGITLGISKKSYDLIRAEFSTFIDKALTIAHNDAGADSVYQCMLQLYPLTKPSRKEVSDEKSA